VSRSSNINAARSIAPGRERERTRESGTPEAALPFSPQLETIIGRMTRLSSLSRAVARCSHCLSQISRGRELFTDFVCRRIGTASSNLA